MIAEEETIRKLERIAAQIFACHGVDFVTARRAGGWSNATWLAGGLALRLATRADNQTIHREAQLARLLPPETGYPITVETGTSQGYPWCLSREIPGVCLGEAWGQLDSPTRARALAQLWRKAQAVHSVDPAAAEPLARRSTWYNSVDPVEAEANLARREGSGMFSPAQCTALRAYLDRFWQVLPAAEHRLNHGDLTLDNALWHDGQVVSLLDFEYAVFAPVELDLNCLLKSTCGPDEPDPLLRQAGLEAARPVLARPGSPDRLFGYAVLYDLWQLECWLAYPDGEGPLETWDPYRRLVSLAGGDGGFYRPLLQSV
jgi:aminoglycoside phosphotransferase (APT) family kinase protein